MNPEIVRALATLEADPENADALAALLQLTEGGGNGHGRGPSQETIGDTGVRRALSEARRVHRERGDFELVVRLIDLELGIEPDKARRADLYYEKGKLLSDELLREDDAVRAFERVLELRPDDEGTQDTLGHIALVRDNWQKIVKKYLDEAKGSTDRQLTTSLYLSVAEIYAKYQPDGEVEKYLKKALEVEPRNAKASARLERILRGEQRWEDLAALYEQRIEAGATKEERVQSYLLLAELQEKRLGKRTEAAESYKKALGLEPANQRALSALVDWYTAEENWQSLIRVYENALRARPRGEPETAMYLQIGMLWWKKLGNLEAADEYWKKVRKAEPAHPAMLDFYRALYANDGQKLLAVLGQAQKVEADAKRRLELGVEMAQLAERSAGAAEKAIDLWKGVLKLDPSQADAVAALKRLYQKTEKWNALLELLKEAVEALPKDDVDGRVAKLLEVVAIYRDKLNLDVMVINYYNHIVALKPDHQGALTALAQKYESMGRWNDLIGVLQRTVDVSTDVAEKTRLLRRVAALWIDKFSNHNQAVKPLEELYALDPADADTVARLRDIHGKRRSWRALLDLERKELERIGDDKARRAKLAEMAKLAADRLGDAREAIAIWNRVLEAAGGADDAEALQMLAGLYERDRRWVALIEILRRQARAKGLDLKQQVVLLEKVGSLFAEKLQSSDKAVEAYSEIVRLMPTHQKAMRTLRELYAAAGRYQELERLYAGQGQYEELCEVLTSVAERVPDPAQKIKLYTRVAEVAQHELKAPERAAKAYERILSIAGDGPECQPAAHALVPIYRASEKWARLLATFEIILNHPAEGAPLDSEERMALHREIIELCEEKLGSKSLAFAWAAKAYQLRPGDLPLQKNLERLASEAEAWEELAEIYQAEVAKETDEARKTERYRQLARIALTRLYKPDEARKWFEEVLQRAPDDGEALANLEQIHTQAGNYKELLAIYRKREARAGDPQRRLEMLFKIAWIEEEQIEDPVAAIATYQKVLEVDPAAATQLRALRALEKLYAGRGDAQGLAGTLERQLALTDADDIDTRLELTHRLGEIYETNLGQGGRALEHYRAAFYATGTPGTHKPTVSALERWLAAAPKDSAERLEVARMLAPVYEQRLAIGETEAAARLVDVLEIQRAGEQRPGLELDLLRRLMDLSATQLGDAQRAYDYGGRVFERAPGDAENRRMMAMLADQLDRPDDWAARLAKAEEQAYQGGDAPEMRTLARALAWDLGQLYDARLGMPSEAEQAYQRVLEREPGDEDAQIALVQLYSVNERWQDLRALLERNKQRALDGEARLSLLYQISDLDEGVLDDPQAATRDYIEVLEIDPGSQRAFRALERLYTTAENWRALDDLLARRVPFASEEAGSPDARAHLTFRRAELHANRLEDPTGATDLYEQALSIEPRHEGARKGLETLMKRPDLRQRIARALEPLYREDESWPKLALVLGAQREAADGHEAAALLTQLALLQEEKLGARQLALATWREALRIEPADKKVRDNVERLALLLGRQAELAMAWEEAFLAAEPTDLKLRGELLEKAAELYEDELGDVDRARTTWRRLLDLDPTNLHTARPAAAALARLYQTAEDWRALIEVLHRQAGWTEKAAEKKELLFRIGTIQEDLLVDPGAAIGTYREILDEDAADLRALDALEKLHHAQGQWPELVDVLRRRLDLTTADATARRELMWRIAQLNERELGDGGEAIAGYHAILDEQPHDVPALEALARLYEGQNRPADLLEILERRLEIADAQGESAHATRLRLQIAAIDDGFGRRDQALERFAEVLTAEPRNSAARVGVEKYLEDPDLRLRAAEVLEPYYRQASELDKQIQLAELWAQHAPDPRERITRLMQIAELKERAGDGEAAFDALARAARVGVGEPELPGLLDGIERLAPAAARPKLVALYRELGPDILDAAVQERVYLAVAAESHKLGDRETAREYYRRVLDMAPDHPRALDALESIYVEGREWDPLYEVYVRRSELAADDDDRRRHYLMQLAKLCAGPDSPLDRPMEAIRALEQVLEMFPTDAEAGKALEARYVAAHRHAELAELLEQRLGFCEDVDEAVALRFRLAQIYDEDLADADRAVENYRAALGGDPAHAGAIRALEKYLDDDGQRVSAAEVLEPVYVARHDWPSLVRIYQIRLEAADDPRIRLTLVKRIARLYEEQLEDLDGAFTWYARVFREDPTDRATRDQLGRLAGILDGWSKLADVYEGYLADEGGEGAVGTEVLRTVAAIYHARLEDVDRAKAAYERLLELDGADEAAFWNLEQLLSRSRRHADLLQVYRDSADHTLDMERKKALLYKQAALQENELADADGAVDTWRSVLDVEDGDERAVNALDRLYTAGGRWHDLVELTLRRLERCTVGDSSWVALKLRLGGIYEQQLSDLPSAIDAYEEVLGHASGHPEAVRALERLIVDHDHTYRIAQILEPIYREQDAWQKLVVIYDAELEFIEDKPQRIERLKEIARIHEKRGGDVGLAFNALARAWTEEAAEPDAADRETELFHELRRLAHMLRMWRQLVDVLQKAVADTYDYDLAARVHARVAEVQENQLGDRASAIDSWRKVVGVRDDDDEAWHSLERLLADEGRNRELVQVLEKRAGLASDVESQKELAYRAAELYEGPLEEPEAAIATWRHVLTLDDGDRQALDALERLYFAKGAYRELAAILAQKIEQTPDPGPQRALRVQLAELSETELHDALAAIDAYKGVLAHDPRDVQALEASARLYAAEGLWADHLEAVDALAEAAGAAGDGARKTELVFKAAQVLEREVGDPEAAIGRYREVLFASGEEGTAPQTGAKAALEKLVRDEGTRESAAAVLEPYYEQHNDFHALIELTELKLTGESEPQERRRLLSRIAELNEAGIEDLQAAFAAWARVLAEDPADEAAQVELERLAELTRAPGELARVYEERMASAFDPEVQRGFALKLGALYENRLGDDERAIASYHKALDLPGPDGGEIVPLGALDRLLTRGARWRDLADVLEREAQAVQEPDEQAELLYRLGALRAGELVDLDGALVAYRDAIARQPAHAGTRAGLEKLLSSHAHAEAVLEVLEPLYESDQHWEKVVQLAEVRLTITSGHPEQAALLETIAERCERELGDPARALDAMARALRLRPEEPRLADEVERLGEAARDPRRAAETFEAVLDAGTHHGLPTEAARDLGLRTARLWERLGEDGKAEARYLVVLEVDGENGEALEALDRLYRVRNDHAQLARILERRAGVEYDVAQKKRFYAEAAELHERALGDVTAAIDGWQRVLDVDDADHDALDALARLHEGQQHWHELVQLLTQKARIEEDHGAQIGLKARIAAIWAEKIGDLEHAVEAYRDLLDHAPDSRAALDALEELERRRGDWTAVQEVLVRQLQAVNGAAQIPVYRKLVTLAVDKHQSPDDAIGYLHEILQLEPDDAEANRELLRLLEGAERYNDLIDVLTEQANRRAAAGDTAGEIALLVRAADVWEQRLGNPEASTEILERILERDPSNVRALMSLAHIYEGAHDVDKARATLERAVELADSPAERAELHYRLGHMEAEAGGDEAGEASYLRALDADATHKKALAALEKLARARADWARVAELLALRLEQIPEGERRPLYTELAQVYGDKLKQPEAALPYLEQLARQSPDEPTVIEPLADLYFAAGRDEDALPLYRKLAERLGKGKRTRELARLNQRIGAIAERKGERKLALEHYQTAFSIDPQHTATMVALGKLYLADSEWEKARRIYRQMLLQNLDPQSGVTKADVYLHLGEIHEKLGEGPKAAGMYERGLEVDAQHAGLKSAMARVKAQP